MIHRQTHNISNYNWQLHFQSYTRPNGGSMKKTLLASITALILVLSISCALFFPSSSSSSSSSEAQINITPTVYRIAVINLELTESAGGKPPQ